MKGSPSKPQCGFSRMVAEILKFYDVKDIAYVNVLGFPNLRSIIKEVTEWPTYPQLFINGEIVGGSDIVMELHKEDKLKEMLSKGKE